MFRERWTRIQRERGTLAALHAPGLTLTFAELDSQARALRPDGDVFVTRGDTPDILRATLAGLLVQSFGVAIPSQLLTSVPYIVTIAAISLLSMNPAKARLNAPVSLGQVYLETK